MKNIWKLFLSSLASVVITGCIAIHGNMSDGMRITGSVIMYYLLWIIFYGIWDYVEDKAEEVRKR